MNSYDCTSLIDIRTQWNGEESDTAHPPDPMISTFDLTLFNSKNTHFLQCIGGILAGQPGALLVKKKLFFFFACNHKISKRNSY